MRLAYNQSLALKLDQEAAYSGPVNLHKIRQRDRGHAGSVDLREDRPFGTCDAVSGKLFAEGREHGSIEAEDPES